MQTIRKSKPTGQRIETAKAFFLRHYVNTADGQRKKIMVKLADKSDTYRCWQDVEPLIARLLETSEQPAAPTGQMLLSTFVEQHYFPWCESNKATSTVQGYKQVWRAQWSDRVGQIPLVNLSTASITRALTELAQAGQGRYTLGHTKWMLAGAYKWAIAQGILQHNPVAGAKWLCKVKRTPKQREYSLPEILAMLRILEPLDLRAAVALALSYFAALRPCESRGLLWADYDGHELHVKRSVWRGHTGDTKTEGSEASVPVIEPLAGLLEKLRAQQGELATADAPILQNQNRKPISLDSLNWRIIRPSMKKAGIVWRGFYPARRGISSLVTDTSKNALNSTGLLRHSTPITALRHYTRAQKDSIKAALEMVEQMARKEETVQ